MFAQELGRLTAQARAQQYEQARLWLIGLVLSEADGWVKETVQRFFDGCKSEAQKGMDTWRCT